MIKIENYYLDLNEVLKLDSHSQDIINSYYRDMFCFYRDNYEEATNSLFNTLYESGYLIDIRNMKINSILDE